MSENTYGLNAQIFYVDSAKNWHTAIVLEWLGRPVAGKEPYLTLGYVQDDGTGGKQSVAVATTVPHMGQKTSDGNYWIWATQSIEANLEPAPVPTGTGNPGSPP